MNYLYFAEAVVETGGMHATTGSTNPEAIMVPAANYLGADPLSATTALLYFKSVTGSPVSRELVTITYANTADGGGFKKVTKALAQAANAKFSSNDGFIVFADTEAGTAVNKSSKYSKLLNGFGVTTIAIA